MKEESFIEEYKEEFSKSKPFSDYFDIFLSKSNEIAINREVLRLIRVDVVG